MGVEPLDWDTHSQEAGVGNDTHKEISRENRNKDKIPPSSPLGLMLKCWNGSAQSKGKEKQETVKYCCFIWMQEPILQ